MKRMMAALAILLLTALPLAAQEHGATTAPAAHEAMHADNQPHPAISENSSWAGAMVIIILGMFLAAAVIGPVVRALAPPEVPPAHSHDEPPGSSGHHGRSGRIDHNEPEEHGGHGH